MNTHRKTQKKVSRTARKDGGGTQRHSAPEGVETLLFEVSAQDVALLKDDELRELVARLCQATLLEDGLPTTCVTWGGDQREPDGGIDVRVQLRADDPLPNGSWLRWRSVGFQVKATEMGPKKIEKEMCPNDSLQSSIQELLQVGGAYIIAARDSVADQRYKERVAAMRECAVGLLQNGNYGCVDYYDSRRLADWASEYPTVVAWVHAKTRGGALQGWEPYGQWATSKRMPDGKYPPFLPDEKARFSDSRDSERTFINLIQGIERVREVLRKGIERVNEEDGKAVRDEKAVRLVGLSGVGKTRFVQALFEADVGSDALDQELAVYADAGRTLNPAPAIVLDRLISSKKQAILIVDNCSPTLHRELAEQLGNAAGGARVGLLTVEYDIRTDTPNETQVFRLANGSLDLVERIVVEQFPGMSRVDARTIAEFSDGNSRVAIALAGAVGQTGSLAGLSDEEVFDRLFWQRNEKNDALERAATACSLVYSFDGGDQGQESEELKLLAGFARMDVQELYWHLADLKERGLIQERGRWRALLPQAIANRLAVRALKRIPNAHIEQKIDGLAPEIGDWRMLRSFSRRLGYLHESEEAKNIVRKWLQPGGRLGRPDEKIGWSLYAELLANVAPVDQKGALSVIEHLIGLDQTRSVIESGVNNSGLWLTGDDIDEGRVRLLALLRLLAYDASLFDRCLDVLLKFAVVEKDRQGSAGRIAESLFLVTLSGTLAKTEQRLRWLENRLRSDDESVRSIACRCLWKALKSRAFRSEYNFDFGARKRDFGWKPTDEEKEDWYVRFIDLSVKAVEGALPVAPGIKNILAGRFRDLWAVAIKAGGVKDSLSRAVRSFAESGCEDGWKEGWVAIREAILFDGKEMEEGDRNALNELEEVARPKSLLSQLWVLVFGGQFGVVFSDAEDPSDYQQAMDDMAERMGVEFAESEVLLPEAARLVTGVREGRQPSNTYVFGKSLAIHISSIKKGWEIFLEVFESRPESERDAAALRGYLEGVYGRDVALFNRLMDEAAEQKSLVRYIPFFQSCVPLGYVGRDRLLDVMGYPEISAKDFECLAYSPSYRISDDKDVAIIMEGLLGMNGAPFVAARILSYYISECERSCDSCFLKVAYDVLEAALVSWVSGANLSVGGGIDFDLKRVVEFLFGYGVDEGLAERKARCILKRLVEKARVDRLWPVPQLKEAMKAIFRVQPVAALDILVGDDDSREARLRRTSLDREGEICPLLDVPGNVLNRWCRAGGRHRWVYVASVVPAIVLATGIGVNEGKWKWSSQVVALLSAAPNKIDVAETLVNRISKCSWVGSGAEAISKRMPLLDQLANMLGTEHDAQIERWRGRLLGIRRSREKGEADFLAMLGFE